MCGYKPITTFWNDFEIAEIFGKKAVIDTFKRAFKEWKGNYKYLTELVMVLNHKIHQWYMVDNDLARLYNSMWEAADKYAQETLTGEEANYFYRITD
jgi:hypothetical protein